MEYYTGGMAKVGGSQRATASTLPGLSACMYAGDMYVCMYVLRTISYQVPPQFRFAVSRLDFLSVRKASDEAEEECSTQCCTAWGVLKK